MARVKVEAKKKTGRKSKYETNVKSRLEDIAHWARDGLIEEEMCKRLGIAVSSFNLYKLEYSELSEALKLNKEIADYRVTDSLYKATQGYYMEEITKERAMVTDNKGKPIFNEFGLPQYELQVTKVVNKYYPPNVTAIAYWSNNREPEKWKQRQNNTLEISGIKKLEDLMGEDDGE